MRVASINGKRYVLVIVDDYSRYTWTHFLRSKDETAEVLIDFLRLVQRGLKAQVRIVRTDKGTKFLNQTLHTYFAAEGILYQTSVARTPEQNGVVERRNRTLVKAARTMLSVAKVPLFFWAEVIATTCFTQNRSLVIPRHDKTPYHIINDRKPSIKFFHIFGSFCYIVRDGENLDKMKKKGDACIFVGYSAQSKAYRVFNKRTRVIVETIHVNFEELPQMASDHVNSNPVPECQRTTLEHDSLSPGLQCQENVSQAPETVTTSNELDLLFSPMFDELLNESAQVVSKSSVESTADVPNQRQQHTTPLNNHSTTDPTCQVPTQAPTVTSTENMNQAEMIAENAQLIEIVLFIVDSRCLKHMTGNLKLLINFVEKFLGTIKFRNDQIAHILGYGDLVQGAIMIKRVYYVEGLNHNLFSVGQFCDADLEVAFRKSTCYIRDLKGNDLLTGSRSTDLYSITLQSSNSPNLICLMAKATLSQAWLWHHRLSHLNFDTINLLSKNDIVIGLPKNDQIAPILGYGDLVQGAVTIKRVYYVEGLNYNLFSVGQFCDADLEVAFRKSTCYICDLKGNDSLTGSRGTDLYSVTLQDTTSPNPICLMAKATPSQAWTKMLVVVPVSTRELKRTVTQSVAKPLRKTVASESTNQKSRNTFRKLYERVSKACSWWYPKFTPSGYKWKPKSKKENVNPSVSMPLGTVSRNANILEHTTSRRSTVVKVRYKSYDPTKTAGNYPRTIHS
nr:putative ribonuclease H-like domain-containing protein [Tanacetum cinerariifolium]